MGYLFHSTNANTTVSNEFLKLSQSSKPATRKKPSPRVNNTGKPQQRSYSRKKKFLSARSQMLLKSLGYRLKK